MKDLEGDWTLSLASQCQRAHARLEGDSLYVKFGHGPEMRLGPDLRGVWWWGARSSEQRVRFVRKEDGSLQGWVGRENWVLTREDD